MNKMSDLISVIVPVFMVEEYLDCCCIFRVSSSFCTAD